MPCIVHMVHIVLRRTNNHDFQLPTAPWQPPHPQPHGGALRTDSLDSWTDAFADSGRRDRTSSNVILDILFGMKFNLLNLLNLHEST